MSELLAIGVSYKTAPVEVRERLALLDGRAAEFLRDLRGATDVHEAVAVSTCNRTELYLVVGDPVEAESTVLAMLARQAGIRPTGLATAIYSHRNCEAARHLYRVVAGLESMIVGEAEIQGQVKRAYEAALALETAGPLTNHLFRAALATGKRVRTETAIGERQLSLPGVAVAHGPRAARGSGRARGGDRRHRRDQRADRPGARRQRRPDRVRGQPPPRPCPQPGPPLRRADAELRRAARRPCSRPTSSSPPPPRPTCCSRSASWPSVMERARRTARCCSSISPCPRDIDAACGDLDGVSLRDIDDLEAVADRNRKVRQAEARKAEGIIEEEIQHFAGLAGLARGAAHAGRAARPRHGDRRAGGERERRQVGDRLAPGPRARRGGGHGRSSTGSCTTRPLP